MRRLTQFFIKDTIQKGQAIYAADAGVTDAYAISLTPAPTAYTTGMKISFKANTANTGAATLNVNSLGAKSIKKEQNEALETGDIKAGQIVTVVYDGTNFQLQSAQDLPVTQAELGYLAGVTSAIQTQFSGKAASSHAHVIGDVTNLTSSLTDKVSFPNSLMRTRPDGATHFYFFVDDENGNNANDGLTLATAKKTIQAAINLLPTDLQNNEAHIYVHPGTYTQTGSATILLRNRNGSIYFHAMVQAVNNLPGNPSAMQTWYHSLLGGATVRNDGTVNVTGVTDGKAIVQQWWGGDQTLSIYFRSMNWYLAWDAIAANYAHKWKFYHTNSNDNTFLFDFEGAKFVEFSHPILLDVVKTNKLAVLFNEVLSSRIGGMKFINSGLAASGCQTTSGAWQGLIYLLNCGKNFLLTNIYYPANGWHADYPLDSPGVQWVVNGARQVVYFGGSAGIINGFSNMIYSQGLMPDGDLPFIRIDANSKDFDIRYHVEKNQISNASTFAYKILEENDEITTLALSSFIKSVGGSPIIKALNTSPGDNLLGSSQLNFWLDENNNKLMIKLKYANGTIKVGELALT